MDLPSLYRQFNPTNPTMSNGDDTQLPFFDRKATGSYVRGTLDAQKPLI